ncbi:hypothetical protein [Enterococcus hirae]|uniref:hypothetical protein n=1 Tax=Enterococcus hirae TaxID=1354 RepID=UPI001378688F|nr:hypothetical protein [Enterococcus hirae]NBA38142.1 hypothetical protein [Enterococcus hirae]NBA57101.1 hypothetical protein [Enterococcus hirae]
MELQEYVDRYIEIIKTGVTRLYPECDLMSRRSLNLLHNEYLLAVQEYDCYVAKHKRKPDYHVLMERFEVWGIHRSEFFQENERLISERDFLEYYLKYVRSSGLLKVSEYTEEDYRFILQRERYLASQLFQNNCPGIYGYQELNIRQSKKRQDYCLNVLKKRFEADCVDFYAGMKRK